ncbi:engulfment and cell motility protein 1 [Chironomus tepperi]|uniref:engulfment and cell motility protein 1 n=1 Tax=Chironomus tepperi TaxID=113505 RepID=UPI00391F0F4F
MLPPRAIAVKDASIVKIAVEPLSSDYQPQLIEFDQKQPLASIISDLCTNWNIPDYENYSLKFTEQTNAGFVTEKNRTDVKNGSVLRISFSASKTVNDYLQILRTGSLIEHTKCLQKLSNLSSDLSFAIEFINKSGLDLLIEMIEDEKCSGEKLEFALKSFVELMDHGTVSWGILSDVFINRNIAFINPSPTFLSHHIIESSLSILENIVQNSPRRSLVEHSVTFETLLKLLRESSPIIQQNTIALVNALFMQMNEAKRRVIASTFSTKQYRSVILDSCVLNAQNRTEMAHQLSILQSLTLGMLEPRMNDRNVDADAQEKIKELRRIAFESEGIEHDASSTGPRRQGQQTQQHYKKLGFKYDVNPVQDFAESSLLALDCMIYFARNQTQHYTKVVHENSCRLDEYECPFGRTSIELVKVLCDILRIGEEPPAGEDQFHPMFFTHDHPFEEFFCVCIVALNRTWKDMRATSEDFSKVFDVVREQIVRSLATRPRDFENFKIRMAELSYAKITEMRQQERTAREECESTASAIVSLKEKLRPEIMALIREQRLGFLVEGTRFSKFVRGNRSKDKFWYVRLSPNHKVLHYGDCDEKTVPTLDELKSEVRVNDMKQLLVNKECPHVKEIKTRGGKPTTLFSIAYDDGGEQKTLDFVAPDDTTFNYWIDGISCLLEQKMISKQMEEDFETLLSVEIKLRLLDTEGVDISKDAPEIPPEPEDYEFNFEG